LGADQQRVFENIKRYLSLPPVIKAPMARTPFRLYIAAKIRYSFIKKLCLYLFYACSKLRHYLLSSTYIVTRQADVIKHMLQQPILSGRIRKWAYALIEYDLAYESLKSIKGQVVANFIVEHSIDQSSDESYNLVSIHP
jgi:hypothetical protein